MLYPPGVSTTVADRMLRAQIDRPIVIIVAEIPAVCLLDWLTAACAGDPSGLYCRYPLGPEFLVGSPIATLGGGTPGLVYRPPAFITAAGGMPGERGTVVLG
jgi:hypothetical protein